MNKIKYGILGCASITPRFIQGITLSTDGEVEAIASRSFEKAKDMKEQYQIKKAYSTYQELWEDEDIDVIYIPTPNFLHYEHCMESLRHGKHVVCEKPFMLTTKEAKEVFAYARKKNLFIMEAQKIVFLPITNWIKDTLKLNMIGQLYLIDCETYYPNQYPNTHWMRDLSKGGGCLYGSASYTIEYVHYLFDGFASAFQGSLLFPHHSVDDIASIQMKFDEDVLVKSTINTIVPTKNRATFYGSEGHIEIDHYWKAKEARIYKDNQLMETLSFPFESEFMYEVNHINECIQKGLLESPIMSHDMTLKTIEIVEEIIKDQTGM